MERRRLALVVAMMLLLVTPLLSAAAAPDATRSALAVPTVKQVGKAFPRFADGSRSVDSVPWNEILLPVAEDCITYDTQTHAQKSIEAIYSDGSDQFPEITVAVFQFSKVAKAVRALKGIKAMLAHCAGSYADPPDMYVVRTALQVPRIGAAATGYRTVVTGMDEVHSVDIWARKGRRLVHVEVDFGKRDPKLSRAIRLARTAVRGIS